MCRAIESLKYDLVYFCEFFIISDESLKKFLDKFGFEALGDYMSNQ